MKRFEVCPTGPGTRFTLVGMIVGLPAVVAAATLAASNPPDPIGLAAAACCFLVLAALGAAVLRRRVAVDGAVLHVAATLYTRQFACDEILLGEARIVDLRERVELRPRLKTNGFALPGFAAGNFRDREGRRLFCLVTTPRVLVLPMRDGVRVLLSVEHPDALLRSIAGSG